MLTCYKGNSFASNLLNHVLIDIGLFSVYTVLLMFLS